MMAKFINYNPDDLKYLASVYSESSKQIAELMKRVDDQNQKYLGQYSINSICLILDDWEKIRTQLDRSKNNLDEITAKLIQTNEEWERVSNSLS